jgi:hypothetical protein
VCGDTAKIKEMNGMKDGMHDNQSANLATSNGNFLFPVPFTG